MEEAREEKESFQNLLFNVVTSALNNPGLSATRNIERNGFVHRIWCIGSPKLKYKTTIYHIPWEI